MTDAGTILSKLIEYIGDVGNAVYANKIIFIGFGIFLAGTAVNFFLRLFKAI